MAEHREINLRYRTRHRGWDRSSDIPLSTLPFTSAIREGANSEFWAGAQSRTRDGQDIGLFRIREIATGDTVTLCGNSNAHHLNPRSAAISVVGYLPTRVLHGKDTPEVLTATRNLFDFCMNGGPTREPGPEAMIELAFATYGITDRVERWLAHPYWVDWLERGEHHVHPEALAALATTVDDPQTAATFVTEYTASANERSGGPDYRFKPQFQRADAPLISFAIHAGWSGEAAFEIAHQSRGEGYIHVWEPFTGLRAKKVPRGLYALPADLALLVLRAGLSGREAKEMYQQGRLNADVLRTMAALND